MRLALAGHALIEAPSSKILQGEALALTTEPSVKILHKRRPDQHSDVRLDPSEFVTHLTADGEVHEEKVFVDVITAARPSFLGCNLVVCLGRDRRIVH